MGQLKIRAEEYQVLTEEPTKGYRIELSLYDIPREVKGELDKETGILHIHFKYPDQEDSESRQLNEALYVKVGKHSGKILGFEVKAGTHDINEVVLTITKAVEAEIPRLSKFNQRANYQLIGKLIERNRVPIFGDLYAQ